MYTHLDGSVTRACSKPFIARVDSDAPDPTKMAADHSHELPRWVPCWLRRLQGSTRDELLSATTDNKRLWKWVDGWRRDEER